MTSKTSSFTKENIFSYGPAPQLKSINALGKSFNFKYDKLGRRLSLAMGNGITTSYEYDSASRLTKMVHADTIKDVAIFGYRYDKNGNRTQMTTSRDGLTNLTGVIDYEYDDINQLTSATNPLQGQAAESFVYDLLGNKLRGTGDTTDSVYDLNNKLLENQNYDFGYDDSGNLTSKIHKISGETTAYFWSDENELLRIEKRSSLSAPANHVVEYKYDLLGRRIEKNINGTIERYIYDNEDIIAIYDGNGDLKTQFIHGPGIDEPLAMIQDGQTYFYHTDGLGSVIALSNEAGIVQQHYVYDSFGNVSVFDGAGTQYSVEDQPIKNIYGYTSRELDSESDLYYYRARYYNPSSGRFVSEDPIGFESRTANFYKYGANQPINNVDFSGEGPWSFALCTYAVFVDLIADLAALEVLDRQVDEYKEQINDLNQDIQKIRDSDCDAYTKRQREAAFKNRIKLIEKAKRDLVLKGAKARAAITPKAFAFETICGISLYLPIP
ncbi:MAG: hypothetical protein GY909_09385 [Oligoflexia bacterium]|nr:hypothetical protein [Oligoflexia bacterium]